MSHSVCCYSSSEKENKGRKKRMTLGNLKVLTPAGTLKIWMQHSKDRS
jgi:hypothetical protein